MPSVATPAEDQHASPAAAWGSTCYYAATQLAVFTVQSSKEQGAGKGGSASTAAATTSTHPSAPHSVSVAGKGGKGGPPGPLIASVAVPRVEAGGGLRAVLSPRGV